MTLGAIVRGKDNRAVGTVRIEGELSATPKYFWSRIETPAQWHEADGLPEAVARALGYRDLSDVPGA